LVIKNNVLILTHRNNEIKIKVMKTGLKDHKGQEIELGMILKYQYDFDIIEGVVCMDNLKFVVKEIGHVYENSEPLRLANWLFHFNAISIGKEEKFSFGKWIVDDKGLEYDNRYFIEKEVIGDKDWMLHLSEKGWINWNDFIPAFLFACKLYGKQKIQIKTFY